MKTFLHIGVIALSLAAFTAQNAFSQAPTGTVSIVVSSSTNALYDATLTPLQSISLDIANSKVGEVFFNWDDPFTQDGKGKLAGSGATTVFVTNAPNIEATFPGTYQTKGTAKGGNGISSLRLSSKASGTANFGGTDRKLSGSVTYSITIDSVAGTVTGTKAQKASASGLGSASETDTINDVIPPELGDGSWMLVLTFGEPNGTKLAGTATVTLATGQAYPFNFTGSFSSSTGTSKLSLKGTDAGTGSSLSVTLQGSEITSIKGKVSGQTVSF